MQGAGGAHRVRHSLAVAAARALVIACLAIASLVGAAPAAAEAPTAAQLRLLESLSPDQRQALLERLESGTDAGDAPPATPRPVAAPAQPPADRDEPAGPPRIRGGDTVLLDLKAAAPDEETTAEGRAAASLRERARAGNPYRLDKDGRLRIPGVGEPIALAGLTADEATERLSRDPALRRLAVRLSLLNLDPIGVDALKPFGYDLFASVPTTFAAANDMPVPAEYVIGPGDTVKVQLIGSVKANYSLVVGRDGEIRFPELGPISVAGLPYDEMQRRIEDTVAEQMIGTRAVVGLGELRSLQVLVTGEAVRPGSYTVGGLSTMTNALMVSGGVTPIGSLRNVQLKRDGRVIASLDLYALLLKGDSRNDVRIQSGDLIFIPPVGPTAGVAGEIRRPAIYEFRRDATVDDLVTLGGGLTAEAAPTLARLERIDPAKGRVLLDVDLTTAAGRGTRLRPGDILRIEGVRPTLADSVSLAGHVYRPGLSQYRKGLRLTDVLPSVDDLRPNADLHYVLIRREVALDRRVSALSADLARAFEQPLSAANPVLEPRDQVLVFDMESPRGGQLGPLLDELRRQGTRESPSQVVSVDGSVRMPGTYPLEAGMTIADLVRAGGSLDEAAFGAEAELARYEVVAGETRRTQLVTVDLARALAGDPAADLALQPFDLLTIKRVPQWSQQESVSLEGEVRFPGRYAIQRGETLAAVIQRAGGLTDLAFAEGVVFTRQALKEREADQIRALTDRLERDLTALALQNSQVQAAGQNAAQSLSVGQSLLAELRNARPVGRLAIDLPAILAAGSGTATDVLLKDQDRLVVPRRSQEVTVIGEVQTVTSHLYQPGLDRSDYVNLSGGLTQKADSGRVYVVRANGQVVASRGGWFGGSDGKIHPGDTIVVPVDTERLPPLPLWTSVTSIIYNLAVAVAAVNSF